jgi:hypothetical protein
LRGLVAGIEVPDGLSTVIAGIEELDGLSGVVAGSRFRTV